MVFNPLKKFNIFNETKENLEREIKVVKEVLNYSIKLEQDKKIYFNVIIVDNKSIKELNKNYRNIDDVTDVISFALEDESKEEVKNIRLLGDIYISIDKAKEQASTYNHSLNRELSFLAVHGFLHLLGYDHINLEDEKVMFLKQELILSGKGLQN